MKVNRVKYLTGPNLYSYRPTIWIELDIEELEQKPSNLLPGFTDTLLSVMPSLKTHTCSLGYAGGFIVRLYEGTWIGHILEHMALEIQHLAGISVKRGKTITSSKKGIYYVTYDYHEPESGYYAFQAAMQVVESILAGQNDIDLDKYVAKTAELYHENKLGPSTEAIYNAAVARKIPVERVGKDSFLRLGTGSKQKYVQATITSQTSFLAVENSCDKEMTKNLLQDAGLPVPQGRVVSSKEELKQAGRELSYPLVIKPLRGSQGQGVMTNIADEEQLISAYECVNGAETEYIVEQFYTGDDYRFVVVDGQLVAASLRITPTVTGDGAATIRDLIQLENQNPLRGDGHEKPMTKIPLDSKIECYLNRSGLSLDSVPKPGEAVQLLGNANLSTGGSAIDVTDRVHPTYKRLAEKAAEVIGLDVAGIDIISKDATAAYTEGMAAIIEVNAAPGIRMHHHPSEGKPRDVGGAIVDYLFGSREEAAIPIVAVTGTNGKTTTARLVAHLLRKEGKQIGLTNSDGIWINDQCIDTGDCSGPGSARKILSHPGVDAAVLETARGGMLRSGLAFRYCEVGIVTNISEDHLGLEGIETVEDLRKLKQLIPEVVLPGGSCVLNADDETCVQMAAHTEGEVVFFSLNAKNPHIVQAIQEKRTVWYVEEDWIVFSQKGVTERFLPVADVPITINGFARHNIANALAALAAAQTIGRTIAELRSLLITFFPSAAHNRGRFNYLEHDGRKIIVDYAHNMAGIAAIYDTVKHLTKKRIITVSSAAGDRRDQDILLMGKMIAEHSDLFIIKEDRDLRERKPLEIAHLLKRGAETSSSKPPPYMEVQADEKRAFLKAWELSSPGDLLLLFYESFVHVEQFIEALSKPKRIKHVEKSSGKRDTRPALR